MAKQGKCNKCKVRFVWEKEVRGRLLKCPRCGGPLHSTTHLLKKYPTVQAVVTNGDGWLIYKLEEKKNAG